MTGASTRREFLFLQGLAGPFFNRLGRALAARGHGVHRVNFHGGDQLFWHGPNTVNYRGRSSAWPDFFERMVVQRGVTDVVLFGDCRPMHRAAIAVARALHIQVHVFEEGYIRPDFVTVELGGVNGHSPLPRDPDWYLEQARSLPPYRQALGIPSYFSRRALEDVAYNVGALLCMGLYPFYRTHKPWNVLVEYAGWIRKLAQRKQVRQRASATLDKLHADGREYYVFPLQLNSDYQIRLHSAYSGMQQAIEEVIASFAKHAPPDRLLVIKEHPLDEGLINWRKRVLACVTANAVADRVVYLEDGDIAPLVRDACGVVTVNSTTGTLALASNVPVITLGHAVYDINRITYQGTLNQFWTELTPPEEPVFEAFRRVMVNRCLVRGGYFSEGALAVLVSGSVERLEQAGTGRAASLSAATAVRPALGLAAARS